MKKNGFTAMEIAIALVIVGAMVTISVPVYRFNVSEGSHAKVCETNLRVLKAALDSYAMEHDVMPGDLSLLPGTYIQRAYAAVLREPGAWKIRLASWIVDSRHRGNAYAALMSEISQGDINLVTCPADETPPDSRGISYGMNRTLSGMAAKTYALLDGATFLIGDCDGEAFENKRNLASRHERLDHRGRRMYAQVINKAGQVLKIERTDIVRGVKYFHGVHTTGELEERSTALHPYELQKMKQSASEAQQPGRLPQAADAQSAAEAQPPAPMPQAAAEAQTN